MTVVNYDSYTESLKSDPIFKHEPGILFSQNGSDFVGGDVQDYSSELDDYMPANDTVPVKVRDWLLAKGFPARTRPMGSSFINPITTDWADSIDMAVKYLDPVSWPRDNEYNELLEWRHSDFKDVAYPHVQGLYRKWVQLIQE